MFPRLVRTNSSPGPVIYFCWHESYRVFFSKGPSQKSSKYGIGPTQQDKMAYTAAKAGIEIIVLYNVKSSLTDNSI